MTKVILRVEHEGLGHQVLRSEREALTITIPPHTPVLQSQEKTD